MQPARALRAARVITPEREIADGWVIVRDDRIAEVGQGPLPSGVADPDQPYAVLVPGLVDLHNHGGGGFAFTDGPDAALRARDAHLRQGTTTVVASLVTDTIDVLERQVRTLRPLVRSGELGGIHCEGPWLAPQWCGAHPVALLADPDPAALGALTDAGGDALVMVTLAPERAGALEAIRWLTGRGVRVAVGHTDATYDQTRAAIEAGASVATHLYNGARPPHHREPGPSVALLEDPQVFIESIVDGAHLHPAVVRATARSAGERWVLVTDAMAAALMGDGSYQLGTLGVDVVDGIARVRQGRAEGAETAGGVMAGSTLSLSRAVRNAVECGVPLVEAVHAATAAPAAAMGWTDVGRLEAGRRADLVGLDEQLGVQDVMRQGVWVDRDRSL
ncbi:N-acetylglucosamine-6-phosphate deacetylase [Ornithinimicrobium faecis]|uniref:N-acetylglucosamine-6-phosphate deacetylase n=1 Tax=Ornithinimicrobium faecis TaxID=2934158 RepID=A0ABY4YWZ3_9MICO|nr:N-acetylglucosamine-6-phosphate deacetylase [Ornithinimicrobium sp. HY1793]USQ80883.1 N-acetylglucosamine-6-phosphate deacetylase [Ornithinimicrobium sp. HY1793]